MIAMCIERARGRLPLISSVARRWFENPGPPAASMARNRPQMSLGESALWVGI
jgi:hypothetical protein